MAKEAKQRKATERVKSANTVATAATKQKIIAALERSESYVSSMMTAQVFRIYSPGTSRDMSVCSGLLNVEM